MLNMAPDKAADETISFQCYPLPAALLYTGRPALTAVLLLSLFLWYLLILILHPFFLRLCLYWLFSLPSLPSTPKNLPPSSFSLLYLHSVLVSSRYPVHVQAEIRRKDRDKELLIFFDIAMFIFNDAPGFLICVIGLSDTRVAFNFPMPCRQL